MSAVIYHNPRCGKSRETLKLLNERGENVQVVEYLKYCPSFEELKAIISKIGVKPSEIIRKGEKVFKEQYKGQDLTDDEWIQAMIDNPILIERPIVVKGSKAAVGRPAENVLGIL